MPKLTYTCPICDKQLVLTKEHLLGDCKLFEYKCGHMFAKEVHKACDIDFTSADGSGKRARKYQEDGVRFIIESDYNCIIGDQMRLGKTPQAELALKHALKTGRVSAENPALILVRGANFWQWIREHKVWANTLPNGIYPIVGTDSWIPPGFATYIISMDTFGSNGKCMCGHRYHEQECATCKKKGSRCLGFRPDGNSVLDKLKKIPFGLIIADEAHSFKNTDSNRSQKLVDFVSFLNTGVEPFTLKFTCSDCDEEWEEKGERTYDKRIGHTVLAKSTRCPACGTYVYQQQQHEETILRPDQKPCGLILLTGTAIKNRAEEYFVPLNLVAPEKFSSLRRFQNEWLDPDHKGRYSRVKHYLIDAFKREIAPYVLRREKEDVFTDLPPFNRIFTLIEPDRETLAKQYNKILDELEVDLMDKINISMMDPNVRRKMMELRSLCGMMKVMWTCDYLEASLMDSDNQRYAVGIHHHSVRDVMYHKLGGSMNCLKLSGEDSAWQKDRIMREFETSQQRVLIINTLAGGVGMDFHYCNNVITLERQWNSADEEQFEFRFYNPDKEIKKGSTTCEYIIAKGTLDEWWFDMVEAKRRIFGETIANHWSVEQDNGSFRELVERTVGARL